MIRKIKITITIITWNKHMYWCRQRTWWGTCVVSWIRNICLFNGKLWMRSPSGSCSYRNASFRVVIYHSFIVIPKNVPRKQSISMYFLITRCIIEFFKNASINTFYCQPTRKFGLCSKLQPNFGCWYICTQHANNALLIHEYLRKRKVFHYQEFIHSLHFTPLQRVVIVFAVVLVDHCRWQRMLQFSHLQQ